MLRRKRRGGGMLRCITFGTIGICAAGLMLLAPASPAVARDCTPRADQEMDAINAHVDAAKKARDRATTCREIAALIRSYEFLINLFHDPSCRVADPAAGITLLNAKLEPARATFNEYCR